MLWPGMGLAAGGGLWPPFPPPLPPGKPLIIPGRDSRWALKFRMRALPHHPYQPSRCTPLCGVCSCPVGMVAWLAVCANMQQTSKTGVLCGK